MVKSIDDLIKMNEKEPKNKDEAELRSCTSFFGDPSFTKTVVLFPEVTKTKEPIMISKSQLASNALHVVSEEQINQESLKSIGIGKTPLQM